MTTLYKDNIKLSCENSDLNFFLKKDFAESPQDMETFKCAKMLYKMYWGKDRQVIKTLVDEAGIPMFEKMGGSLTPDGVKFEAPKRKRVTKKESE